MTNPTSYAYDASLHCLPCTRERFAGITDGNADEYADSEGNTPTPVYSWMDEADSPQHCDECGEFLNNALTNEGHRYVREAIATDIAEGRTESVVVMLWAPFYGAGRGIRRLTPDTYPLPPYASAPTDQSSAW